MDSENLMTDDIPSQAELARRLQYTARLAVVGKMASGAAHELNQPLNVIRMAAFNLKRAIQKNRLDPELALEKLARIDEQVTRAARLTAGMKAFSPTALSQDIVLRPSDAIAAALELLAKRFSAADAELHYQPTDVACEVQAAPTALQEIIFNLVDNAVEAFIRQGPQEVDVAEQSNPRIIGVAESVAEGIFKLVITDNAGGIDPEKRTALQAPFATEADDGTHPGMGLAICHEVVAGLGGSFDLSSDSISTTATLCFPVRCSAVE